MTAVIFDIDNCLSNDEHRIPLIDWSASNPEQRYAAYHAACDQDAVGNMDVFARACTGQRKIVFFTARPNKVRAKTEAWIRAKLVGEVQPFTLVMRNDGDHSPSVHLKSKMLIDYRSINNPDREDVVAAYDDREDIVEMYRAFGVDAHVLKIHDTCAYTPPAAQPTAPVAPKNAADILADMADTYRARNKVYGDNFKMVAKLMAVLFPKGVPPELVVQDQFHLFELVLVKLSRYAISNLTHIDSAHDAAVYFAMCESINHNSKEKQ
jgi:hypothetical protein